jgi:hypothetical protein
VTTLFLIFLNAFKRGLEIVSENSLLIPVRVRVGVRLRVSEESLGVRMTG